MTDFRFAMADGAWEMTRSMKEVFGDEVVRLMCWSHTNRNYTKKIKSISKINKNLAKEIDIDICKIQWMVQTEQEFINVYELFEKKYMEGNFIGKEKEAIEIFFSYFRAQWGPGSHVSKWYEGANPFSISSNQGVENKNLEIKDDFSYRERLDMTKFVKMQEGIVTHNSMNDDSILYLPRVAILKPDSDGKIDKKAFNLQELGYKYYLENLKQ